MAEARHLSQTFSTPPRPHSSHSFPLGDYPDNNLAKQQLKYPATVLPTFVEAERLTDEADIFTRKCPIKGISHPHRQTAGVPNHRQQLPPNWAHVSNLPMQSYSETAGLIDRPPIKAEPGNMSTERFDSLQKQVDDFAEIAGSYFSIGNAPRSHLPAAPLVSCSRSTGSVRGSPRGSPIEGPVDDVDPEEDKKRKNREAAARCRTRKYERILTLEENARALQEENRRLEGVAWKLRRERDSIREAFAYHMTNDCRVNN